MEYFKPTGKIFQISGQPLPVKIQIEASFQLKPEIQPRRHYLLGV